MRYTCVFLAALAAFGLAQDRPASRPSSGVKLPAADQAKRYDEPNPITIMVARASTAAETKSRDSKDWNATIGKETFTLDKPGTDKLAKHLEENSRAEVPKGMIPLADRAVLVSADVDAPFAALETILQACATAKLSKVSIEVAPSAKGAKQAFSPGLPVDQGVEAVAERKEIRVLMSWNTEQSKVERIAHSTVVPTTPEGDKRLEELLKWELARHKKNDVEASLVIDSGPLVPWQNIVDVLNIAQRVGIEKVEFATGQAKK